MSEENKVIQKESLKLERNSKGYNWEIKLLKNEGETDEDVFKRVQALNQLYVDNYGSGE